MEMTVEKLPVITVLSGSRGFRLLFPAIWWLCASVYLGVLHWPSTYVSLCTGQPSALLGADIVLLWGTLVCARPVYSWLLRHHVTLAGLLTPGVSVAMLVCVAAHPRGFYFLMVLDGAIVVGCLLGGLAIVWDCTKRLPHRLCVHDAGLEFHRGQLVEWRLSWPDVRAVHVDGPKPESDFGRKVFVETQNGALLEVPTDLVLLAGGPDRLIEVLSAYRMRFGSSQRSALSASSAE